VTTGPAPACRLCTHYFWDTEKPYACCAAFPDGIPDAIYWDGEPHVSPREGDGGKTFEIASLAQLRERGFAP
jgi:hypothetical protein